MTPAHTAGRLLLVALAGALLLLLSLGTPRPAQAAGPEDAAALAAEFATCAQQRGSADVILLLDRSLSLRESDPELVRRDASRDLAKQLAAYAQASGVDVRMQVAGFDGRYQGNPWRTLSDSLDTVLDEIDEMSSNEGLGPATDYWMALDGARSEFAEAADDRPACQFLLWFSDGQYDVDEGGSFGTSLPYAPDVTLDADSKDEVIEAGKDSICSAKQGPMNPMRATGVFVATIGLSATEDVDLAFLRQATEGSDNCGRPPLENHAAYLEATEAGALTLGIAGLSGGQLSEGAYNGRDAALPFGLDEAVSRASVLAYAGPIPGQTRFGLSGPTGATVWWGDGAPGTQTVSNAEVSFETVSGQSGRFTIARPDDQVGWKGTWSVHLRAAADLPADAKAQMVVTVIGDLRPEWRNPVTEAAIEQGLDLDIALRSADGAELTGDHPGVRVTVDYVDQDGGSTTLVSGLTTQALRDPVHVSLPESPGAGRLSLRLDLTTDTDPPTPVVPAVTAYDLALAAAGEYPAVGRITFPSTAGTIASEGTVSITGPGCVWLDGQTSEAAIKSLPDGVDTIAFTGDAADKASCVAVEAGQTRDFHVALTPSAQGNGSIVGDLAIQAAPAGPGADVTYTVPYSAQRTKEAVPTTKWLTLVVITVLGLLLGALPLLVTRARMARIRVRDSHGPLQVTRQRFSVIDGRVSGLHIRSQDLRPVHSGTAETVRRLDLDQVSIVPEALGNPFTVPDCRVTRQGGPVVTSRSTAVDGGSPGLPLVLTGQWVAWPVGPDEFEALVFLSSAEVLDSLLPSTNQQVTERIESSAALLTATGQGRAPATVPDGAAAPADTAAAEVGSEWREPGQAPGWGDEGRGRGPTEPGPAARGSSEWGAEPPGERRDPNQW